MKIRIPFLCIFLLTLFCVHAYAAEDPYYIFQINQSAEDLFLPDCVEPVYETAGIYRTNDFSVIHRFEREKSLIAYTLDADISLLGFQEDAEMLQTEHWSRAMLAANYASENNLDGAGVRIGLIDSGIRPDFGDITGATVMQGVNFLVSEDSEKRNNTEDLTGHGTFVASIIASDVAGLAPQAELVPLKCFVLKTTSISYVISAIYAAVDDYQCDIINLSLGTTTSDPFLEAAITYAYDHGVIMVAASGNLGKGTVSTGNDTLYYPAAYDEVISVGALDEHKQIASFSSQNQSVWVSAPGDGVLGLSRSGTEYTVGSGTSYASPFVAAAAALAKQSDPAITQAEFMRLLQETAEDIGEEGPDSAHGYGALNVGLLLAKVRGDSDSLVLSRYDNQICFSSYHPEPDAAHQVVLAYYDNNRRFAGCSLFPCGAEGYTINNYVLPTEIMSFSVFVLEHGTFTPLMAAKKYLP